MSPLGEQLLADVRPAHEQLRRAFVDVRQAAAARTRELLVGFSRSIPADMIEAVCTDVEKARPCIRIVQVDVTQLDVLQYQRRVGLGLDIVVGWFPADSGNRPAAGMRAGPVIALGEPAVLIHPAHPLASSARLNIEQLADLTFIDVTGMESMKAPWVPHATPAGQPIERERRDLRYSEELFAHLVREHGRLAHLTTRGLSTAWPLAELVLVPVDGWRPFEARAMWPAAAETPAIKQFAQLASSIGRVAGWQ